MNDPKIVNPILTLADLIKKQGRNTRSFSLLQLLIKKNKNKVYKKKMEFIITL